MTILFILLVIFVVWPLARAIFIAHRMRTRMRQAYEETARRQQQYRDEQRRANRKPGWSGGKSRDKVIKPGEGEYVEWEEISVTSETTVESGDTGQTATSRTTATGRVVDVEWEDIDEKRP